MNEYSVVKIDSKNSNPSRKLRSRFAARSAFGISARNCWAIGFALLFSLIVVDALWSQDSQREGRGRGRSRRQRDPGSFLRAYRDEQVATMLGLSDEQKQQLDKLRTESFGLVDKIRDREELVQAVKEVDDRAVNVLNESQKVIWQKRKDELIAEAARNDSNSGEGTTNSNSTNSSLPPATTAPTSTPSSPAADPGANAGRPASRADIPVEQIPEGAIAVASFAPSGDGNVPAVKADAKSNKADVKSDAVPITTGGPKEEANISFNFRYANWDVVLKLFAEWNDLSLDLNDVPPGTFNYLDRQRYTMTEALDVLNGYLLSKGYVLVRRDRFLVCLNIIDNPIPPNVVPTVTEDELLSRGKNELLSLILPMQGLDAKKMEPEVKALLGPQAKVVAMENTNSLIMTDIGANLRRVSQLLKASKPLDNRETAFKSIPLKNISAADAERMVRRHFGLNTTVTTAAPASGGFGGRFGGGGFPGGGFPGGFGERGWGGRGRDGGGGGDNQGGNQQNPPPAAPVTTNNSNSSPFANKIQVTADTRGNFLLITASAVNLKVVEEFVANLDTDTDSTGSKVQARNNPVFFQGHSVSGGDVASLSRMLSNIMPGVVVGEDTRSGKIYAQGTKEEHAEIQRLIRASSDAGSTTSVFQLVRLDPAQVTQSLRNLFLNDAPRAPSIEFDASGRKILVRGTAEQLNQVRLLLKDLGEWPNGSTDEEGNANADRGNIRRLNLGGHDAEEILDLVKSSWGDRNQSPIRIVIPSKPSPIRDRRVPGGLPPIEENRSQLFDPRQRDPQRSDERNLDNPNRDAQKVAPAKEAEQPREEKPARKFRSATTQSEPRRTGFLQVSSTSGGESEPNNNELANNNENELAKLKELADAPNDQAIPALVPERNRSNDLNKNETKSNEAKPEGSKDATSKEVDVTIMGNDLILTSPDTKSLDKLEEMISAIIAALPTRTRWTVFYLRSADATEAAQMVEKLFPQSAVTTTPTSSSSSDSIFSGFAGGFSSLGRSMMNATGLNQSLAGAQSLKVITDVRSNALFVSGPRDVVRDIEYVLELLDSSDLPGTMRDRLPRTIPVEYADIDEVASIIESVFKDSMTAEAPQQQGQPFNPFQMMFNRGQNQPAKPKGVDLTIGVDRRTSNLIVSCNETMFRRIETMVQDLDYRAREARPTVQLMPLKTADPAVVAATLTSIMPRVTVGTTKAKSAKKQDAANPAQSPPQGQGNDQSREARFMQQMLQNRAGGGNPGGGGQSGGGQGGQSRNSGQGSGRGMRGGRGGGN